METDLKFEPDLSVSEMDDAFMAIHLHTGPRLATRPAWNRTSNRTEAPDQLGWIEWYRGYARGRRTDGDEQQIKKWHDVKRMHGGAFRRQPTPRRAFTLRYWAIDPMKFLDSDEDRKKLQRQMDDYQRQETEKQASTEALCKAAAFPGIQVPAVLPRVIHQRSNFAGPQFFSIGLISEDTLRSKAAETLSKSRGCLMLQLLEPDAFGVLKYSTKNIDNGSLTEGGRENFPHVTVAWGFTQEVDPDEVVRFVIAHRNGKPLRFKFSELSRFEKSDEDVIIMKVESEDLHDLHAACQEHFGDRLQETFPDYKPHCTLAYVKKGECAELDGPSGLSEHVYISGLFSYQGAENVAAEKRFFQVTDKAPDTPEKRKVEGKPRFITYDELREASKKASTLDLPGLTLKLLPLIRPEVPAVDLTSLLKAGNRFAQQEDVCDIVASVKSAAVRLGSHSRPWDSRSVPAPQYLLPALWRSGFGEPYFFQTHEGIPAVQKSAALYAALKEAPETAYVHLWQSRTKVAQGIFNQAWLRFKQANTDGTLEDFEQYTRVSEPAFQQLKHSVDNDILNLLRESQEAMLWI